MASELRVHLSLVGYAASSLARRWQRTAAVAGGLVLAVALVSAVLSLTDALRAEAGRSRAASPDLVVQRMLGGRPALIDEATSASIQKLPGVASVVPRVWGYLFLPAIQGNVTVMGQAESSEFPIGALLAGRGLTKGERGACVLGRELAAALGVQAGDKLRFPAVGSANRSCTVVGLFASPVSLYTADVALVPEADARALLDLPAGQATDLAVTLTNPDESSVIASAVIEKNPSARVLEKRLYERVHTLSYGRRAGLVLGASLPALLALLALAYDRAAGLGAGERREIAILKACGWSTGDVLAVKMYESLVVALIASLCGMLLAYLWAFVLGAPGLREVLGGWSTLYPTAKLTPEVTLGQILGLSALVTAPYVALSVGPSWRAAIVDPMEALRGGLSISRSPRLTRRRGRRCDPGARVSDPRRRVLQEGQRSPTHLPPGQRRGAVSRQLRQLPGSRAAERQGRHAGARRAVARRRPGRLPAARPPVRARRHGRRRVRRRSRRRSALRAVRDDGVGGRVHRPRRWRRGGCVGCVEHVGRVGRRQGLTAHACARRRPCSQSP